MTLARHTEKRISRIRALRLAAEVLSAELSVTTPDRGMLLQTYGPLPHGRGTCLRRYGRVALGGTVRRMGRLVIFGWSPGTAADTRLSKNKKSGFNHIAIYIKRRREANHHFLLTP